MLHHGQCRKFAHNQSVRNSTAGPEQRLGHPTISKNHHQATGTNHPGYRTILPGILQATVTSRVRPKLWFHRFAVFDMVTACATSRRSRRQYAHATSTGFAVARRAHIFAVVVQAHESIVIHSGIKRPSNEQPDIVQRQKSSDRSGIRVQIGPFLCGRSYACQFL